MIKRLLGGVRGLFGPDLPLWAVELTASHVAVVGAAPDRRRVVSRGLADLAAGALVADLKEANVVDVAAVRAALEQALEAADFEGAEVALVIPDDAVRITLLRVDALPAADGERQALIRWKLKKTVPFDVESARLAYQTLGTNGSVELLVTVTRPAIVEQYETLVESLGLHAGIVSPSTLAALNLLEDGPGEVLFVKKDATAITTSIMTGGRLRFYRKVPPGGLYDAVYPTLMYYQDRLDGAGLSASFICGRDIGESEAAELARRLGSELRRLYSPEIGDAYKPALGALQS